MPSAFLATPDGAAEAWPGARLPSIPEIKFFSATPNGETEEVSLWSDGRPEFAVVSGRAKMDKDKDESGLIGGREHRYCHGRLVIRDGKAILTVQ